MTQPPEEPPPEGYRPEDGWQPPGPAPTPPPQRPGPPYEQYPAGPPPPSANPYGGGTTNYYRPIESGRMSRSVKVVLGVLIGVFSGFFLWFLAAIGFAGTTDDAFLFYAAAAPLIVPAPLLIWKATRPWAVGLLIGTAVASIGMSSLCAALIGAMTPA